MRTVRFICSDCGFEFESRVFEEGEAEERRLRPVPIRCPRCRSHKIERR